MTWTSYGDARSRSMELDAALDETLAEGRCRPALVRSALVERRRRIIEVAGADAGGSNCRDRLPHHIKTNNCKIAPC